jgi:hypothetical protein
MLPIVPELAAKIELIIYNSNIRKNILPPKLDFLWQIISNIAPVDCSTALASANCGRKVCVSCKKYPLL